MQFPFACLLSTLVISGSLARASPFDFIFGNGTQQAQSQSESQGQVSFTNEASQDSSTTSLVTAYSQGVHSHQSATIVSATISSLHLLGMMRAPLPRLLCHMPVKNPTMPLIKTLGARLLTNCHLPVRQATMRQPSVHRPILLLLV